MSRLVLLDPTQCFAGYRPGYLLHALPVLLRPTAARARAFLAWETAGAPIDPAFLDLYGLAAELPDSRPVVGKRPTAAQLRGFTTPTLVLLAADSRPHDPRRVDTAARRLLPESRRRSSPASRTTVCRSSGPSRSTPRRWPSSTGCEVPGFPLRPSGRRRTVLP